MSLPSSTNAGGPYRRPRPDLYTALLGIALGALLIGILCLYLEMNRYEWKIDAGPQVALPAASAPLAHVAPEPGHALGGGFGPALGAVARSDLQPANALGGALGGPPGRRA